MNPKVQVGRSIIGAVVLGFLIFSLLLAYAPDAVPFSTNNRGWNGLYQIASEYHIVPSSLGNAPSGQRSVLLIIAPVKNFSQADASQALSFVQNGGILVIADNSGVSNSLLIGMGAHILIRNGTVNDPLYNWKDSSYPIAIIDPAARQHGIFSNVSGLALNNPSPLEVTSPAEVIGISSQYSVLRNSANSGPFPLVAVEQIGSGLVVVIGDPTIFTGSELGSADNSIFARNILSNSVDYLDTSHWPVNVGTTLRASLLSVYADLSEGAFRYAITLGFVAVALALFPIAYGISSTRPRQSREKEASTKYNMKILERIRKDRERFGVAEPE